MKKYYFQKEDPHALEMLNWLRTKGYKSKKSNYELLTGADKFLYTTEAGRIFNNIHKEVIFLVDNVEYLKFNDVQEDETFKNMFKPFDKVLVKIDQAWNIEIFETYDIEDLYPYSCLAGGYHYCVPYEGNEEFLLTKL